MGYPYPFFSYSWNKKLPFIVYTCIVMIVFFVLSYVAIFAGLIHDQIAVSVNESFEKSFWQGIIALLLLFGFFWGYFCYLTLWISMWVFWARQKSFGWFFGLLFGFLGSSVIYYYLVYKPEWEKYLRIHNSIEVEKNRIAVETI